MQDVEERIQHGVDLGKKSGFIKSGQPIVCITGKEIEIIHRLFLVIAMYCQASSSQLYESLNLPCC